MMTSCRARATAYPTKRQCLRIMPKRGIRHFTDDGISGTTFEREGFQAMLAEVEKGNIGTIIVKDMSRLGRNHQAQLGVGLWQNKEIKNPYKWGSSTIAHIL